MYQGFAYISQHGILKDEEYRPFVGSISGCEATPDKLTGGNMKDIGYVEIDGRTNEELKEVL